MCVQMKDLGRDIFSLVVDKESMRSTIEEESVSEES